MSGIEFDLFAGSYIFGVLCAFWAGWLMRGGGWRARRRRPFDWAKECPELIPAFGETHVRVLAEQQNHAFGIGTYSAQQAAIQAGMARWR
jgi:hypothetical protein